MVSQEKSGDVQKPEEVTSANRGDGAGAADGPVVPDFERQDSRQALRAYLARTEVRLSTMHRIAGAFLSGAALLILLPILLKDALSPIMHVYQAAYPNLPPLLSLCDGNCSNWIYALTQFSPLLVVFGVPIAALYLLLMDLSKFYFTPNIPGTPNATTSSNSHPRFSLTAIAYPSDEGEGIRRRLRKMEFYPNTTETDLSGLVLPRRADGLKWLKALLQDDNSKQVALPTQLVENAGDTGDAGGSGTYLSP